MNLEIEIGVLKAKVHYLEQMMEATIRKIDDNQPERLSPEDSYSHTEFGCSFPVRFKTQEGFKIMEPGKIYDQNLNEI